MNYPILIVDDNRLIVDKLSKTLHSLGYEITVAHSGKEALKKLHRKKQKIVLLDIGLPNMNGYEIAKNIRSNEKFSETILVAFSGKTGMKDKLEARKAGFDHHISKPASVSEIKMILNAYDF